jgi:hypothetical protein
MRGSFNPNFSRKAMATSGGILGFETNSEKGSPGAIANTVNKTKLMPSKLGTAISNRRKIYRNIQLN